MTHESGIEAAARAVTMKMQLQDFGSEDTKGDFVCTVDQIERLESQSALAAEAAIQAYLSASDMVLVPRAPTERMVNAGYGSNHFGDHDPHYAYVRMIADAPDPFKSKP